MLTLQRAYSSLPPHILNLTPHVSASSRDSLRWWIDFIFGLVCGVFLWILSEEIKQLSANAGSVIMNDFETVIQWLNTEPG